MTPPDGASGSAARTPPVHAADDRPQELSADVPILMYHSIAEDGPAELAPYRISPASFAAQLAYLRQNAYRAVALSDWAACIAGRRLMAGRAVIISFDDGYQDFADTAWPLLQAAGFTATMFVVTDRVGGVADWDAIAGKRPRLMDWPTLRDLQSAGLTIGSHTAGHPSLTALSREAIIQEARRSRVALKRELKREVTELAFPFGHWNGSVCEAVAAAGYQSCVTTYGGISTLRHDPLSLPRLEIFPHDDLAAFAAKLAGGRPRLAALQVGAGTRRSAPRRTPLPPQQPAGRQMIHPDYAQKLAAQLDALVGDFVALQSRLLAAGAPFHSLQSKLTQAFRQPVSGRTRQAILPYHVLAPDVRVGFEPAAEVILQTEPKQDFTASPESCVNSLTFEFAGASRWLSIETVCDWPDLSTARRFQLGIYASISRTTQGRAVLRLPRKDGTSTDELLTGFELSRDDRCVNRSGEVKLPDFVGVNLDQKPMLIVFLETNEDITLRLNYLNVYFD